MNIPKEYALLLIAGLYLLAIVLDALVEPLNFSLSNPYQYLQDEYIQTYALTTASIFIKVLALIWTPLWFMSFFNGKGMGKPIVLLILSSLMQLYALQAIATRAEYIPLEWTLPIAFAGALLLIPTLILFIRSIVVAAHANLTHASMREAIKKAQEEQRNSSE